MTGAATYAWAGSTSDVRALEKASSATDRIAACWYTPSGSSGASYTIDVNFTDGKSHQLAVYVLDWDNLGPRAETIQVMDAVSGSVLDTESASSFRNGEYLIWTVQGHVQINVINRVPGSNAVVSGLFFDPVPTTLTTTSGTTATTGTTTTTGTAGTTGTSAALPAAAVLVGSDVATQGSWKGVYGADGYNTAGDTMNYPSYATVTFTGAMTYTWAGSTTDVRAVQKAAAATDRLAACWYTPTLAAGSSYTIDVNITDGNAHELAMYMVDWDNYGPRAETVQVTDAVSGAVLNTDSVSAFRAGGYLVWIVQGHVKVTVTNNVAGSNAVVSGLFFDPAGTMQATSGASTAGSAQFTSLGGN